MTTRDKLPLPFRGVGTALITPFADGGVDFPALRALIERQMAGGVHALIVAGTTGEAVTLTARERREVLREARLTAGGTVPIVMGTGSPCTREAIERAKEAEEGGADAILVVTPYYNKGTREGIVLHYLAIADAVGIPLILYNVPSRTGVDLPLPAIGRLAAHPRIVAIKEASGSIARVADIIAAHGEKMAVYSGNDGELLPTLSLGGAGIISVLSNLLPSECVRLYSLYTEGRREEAARLSARLLPLARLLFADTNPAPAKYAASCLGLCREEVRLPLAPPEEALKVAIEAEIRKFR